MRLWHLVATQSTTPPEGAYGTVTCTAPTLPGATVDVQATDAGHSMMGQNPVPATLLATPTRVSAGNISLVVADTGQLWLFRGVQTTPPARCPWVQQL